MSEPAVQIENLSVSFGQIVALSDISLVVAQGDYLGIIGPNGGGKSTLLKAILGLVPLSSGNVRIFGSPPGKGDCTVGYVPQSASLNRRFPITVEEAVLTGRMKAGLSPFFRYGRKDWEDAGALLESVGIAGLAGRQISELSGGELQRMLIARALAVSPKLLILDEPTASVDAASRERIFSLLAELNRRMTIILVTHDLLAVASNVRQLACLNVRLVCHGSPELTGDIVEKLYGCPVDLIAHGVPHRVLKEHGEERR